MDTIQFNRPYNSGSEIYNIAQSIINGYSAGDGDFCKSSEKLLQKMLSSPTHPLLTTSCTSALEIAAIQSGYGKGDEFILPSYTFVSTANAFCLRGMKPIFCDIDEKTLNINESLVSDLVTSNSKVVVPVHYAGISCDMDTLSQVANKSGLLVIEDAAQAITSTYKGKSLGTMGDFGAFSFHETKNIICGEGGALVVKDQKRHQDSEIIREKGTNRSQFFRGQVDKYTWRSIGSSYVLSDILAAYLHAQLTNAASIQSRRINLYNTYIERLSILAEKGLAKLPFIPEYNEHNAHIFYLLFDDNKARNGFIDSMKTKGIMSDFHYIPLHLSPVGESYGYKRGQFPITEKVSETIARLPLCSYYDEEVINKVCDSVLEYFGL